MITATVGIGILAIAAVLWAWAYLLDHIGSGRSTERTYSPETEE